MMHLVTILLVVIITVLAYCLHLMGEIQQLMNDIEKKLENSGTVAGVLHRIGRK
jgi:hypothetical protein